MFQLAGKIIGVRDFCLFILENVVFFSFIALRNGHEQLLSEGYKLLQRLLVLTIDRKRTTVICGDFFVLYWKYARLVHKLMLQGRN